MKRITYKITTKDKEKLNELTPASVREEKKKEKEKLTESDFLIYKSTINRDNHPNKIIDETGLENIHRGFEKKEEIKTKEKKIENLDILSKEDKNILNEIENKKEEKPIDPIVVQSKKEAKADIRNKHKHAKKKNNKTIVAPIVEPKKEEKTIITPIIEPKKEEIKKLEEPKKEENNNVEKALLISNLNKKENKEVKKEKVKKNKKTKKPDVDPVTGKKRFKKRYVLIPLLLLFLFGIGFAAYKVNSILKDYLSDVPELNLDRLEEFSAKSYIYDRDGNLLTDYGGIGNVTWVRYEDCPQYLIDAFISIEDERFFNHNGFDFKRLVSEGLNQITQNKTHGASTITQQLIRNVYLTPEVTYKRKVQELYLSVQLEKILTEKFGSKEEAKKKILEYYMNHIYFGDLAYGVGAAADDYFDKQVKDLTLKESALIAGVTNSPSYYNPRAYDVLDDNCPAVIRTNTVLYTMHNLEKIDDATYEKTINEPLVIAEKKKRELYPYPHFVEYTVNNVAEKLLAKEGKDIDPDSVAIKIEEIKNGGYKIYSTIDTRMQDILRENVEAYQGYPYSADGTTVEPQIVIMENHTGQVLAMIGAKEEPTDFDTFNRATMSYQPTGSSFKPISVYAPCIEVGLGTGSSVKDTDDPIPGYNASGGVPGGDRFNRSTTMREALEYSHNVPAVRFLLEGCGIDESMKKLVLNGFNPDDLSPSPAGLALGASSVTTLQVTAAYQTFANDGVYIEPHGFTKVIDKYGEVVLDSSDPDVIESHRVFTEATNYMTVDMLRTNMINGYGVNARLSNIVSAGKTGTHEWEVVCFAGFTPYYTSYVRMTTDSYSKLPNSWSYTQPTRLWRNYMTAIHNEYEFENKPLTTHDASELDIVRITVCKESGKAPTEGCPTASELFLKGTYLGGVCEGHKTKEEKCWESGGYWENDACIMDFGGGE